MTHRIDLISGSQALAYILRKENVAGVYAYPGTSELALCSTISTTPGLKLINSRGDAEAAFMSAGGCLIKPLKSLAILHGARGLTNAAGAIIDANRNEIASLYIVGLPSTNSARFLPPHGENNLIANFGKLVKYADEIVKYPRAASSPKQVGLVARAFLEKIRGAFRVCKEMPYGSVVLGIPQNILENIWFPKSLLRSYTQSEPGAQKPSSAQITITRALIDNAQWPVALIDDLLFRDVNAKDTLVKFSNRFNVPYFQVNYKRGPMLFEQMTSNNDSNFLGLYDPNNQYHRLALHKADLFITLDDRNAYPRVTGCLSNCKKIAITSNPQMTTKNGYLTTKDTLLFGNVRDVLLDLIKTVGLGSSEQRRVNLSSSPIISNAKIKPDCVSPLKCLAIELAKSMKGLTFPVIVDDSQMFGGLIAQNYQYLPKRVRVFGDHGGFVGAGISYAAGFAKNHTSASVFCLIGDQGFINGFKGLFSATESNVKVVYLVCNNGRSVSLTKQSRAQGISNLASSANKLLGNIPGLNYARLASALKINYYNIPNGTIPQTARRLRAALRSAIKCDGVSLINLHTPSDPIAWRGIWSVHGNEAT